MTKLAENHEDEKSSKELTGDEAVEVRACKRKDVESAECFISTVTSYNCYDLQASFQKEPLPFKTTILNP